MKIILNITLLIYCLSIYMQCQDKFYWKDAPTSGTKIYLLKFFDPENGIAISQFGETLKTVDSGEHWFLSAENEKREEPINVLWSAEIFCSVMSTNNGGITWVPYLQKPQEHFCRVYFKDMNTGWMVAEEFLNKVVSSIFTYLENEKIESLIDQPHQCTEYYTSVDSGWALGWCIRSFEKQ